MLYDTRWDKQITVDPYSLTGLIMWLFTKPADEPYEYSSNRECVLAQYFRSHDLHSVDVVHLRYWDVKGEEVKLPESFGRIAVGWPWTFGAALRRALACR